MKAKYIRVSTQEQNESRQIEKDVLSYVDKCSGSIPFEKRESALKLISDINKGIVTSVYVHSIDRLGRDTIDILKTISFLTEKGICLISEKEGVKTLNDDGTENLISKMIIGILSTLSEFELQRIKERQREGIEKAKINKAYIANGRPKGTIETKEEFLKKPKTKAIIKRITQGHSLRECANLCECSVNTIQKVKMMLENV